VPRQVFLDIGASTRRWKASEARSKTESLHHYRFATREQARQVTFEYIEVFYNRVRCHVKIGNQTPAYFANQLYAIRQQSAA
jgi:putative transposase